VISSIFSFNIMNYLKFFMSFKGNRLCLEPLNILSSRKIGGILLVFVTRMFIQILRFFFFCEKCNKHVIKVFPR